MGLGQLLLEPIHEPSWYALIDAVLLLERDNKRAKKKREIMYMEESKAIE